MGLEKKTKHVIKKHAATIHSSNTLSLLQRKVSNALLFHAYQELLTKEEHEITIKQLCKLISYQGNNHAVIKEALKGLLSTVIEWNVVSDSTGSEDWTASTIIASVSLKGPMCYYAYSPRMKQLLHSPTMFGKINLFIQSRFKSSYGLALYENCIRYQGLHYTKWFDIQTFRKLMGVPASKYTIFRDFKKRVLDKSIEEVNSYSDLIVEPELYRQGRQVTKIRFSLKERAKKTRLGNPNLFESKASHFPVEDQLIHTLTHQFSLPADLIKQILTQYSREFIFDKITLIESSKNYLEGKVQNLAAYFLSALKNDYKPAKPSSKTIRDKQHRDLQHAIEIKKVQVKVRKLRKAYLTYREQTIDNAVKSLPAAEYAYFMQDFRDYATDSIRTVLKLQRNKYSQETVLESPQIKAILRQFALHILTDLRDHLLSFENYMTALPEKQRQAWEELKQQDPTHELLVF